MHSSFRILEKIPARFCRRFLCSTAYIPNNAENNAPVPATTNSQREVTVTHQTFNNVLNLLKEVTKNGSENNVDIIITNVMEGIQTNQLHVLKECAAEILKNEDCRYMLNVLNNNMPALSTTQAVNTLMLLKKLHVPQKTVIAQNTLGILRSKMNDLYIKEIVSVVKLLHNYNDTPLARALLSGLKLVFELKVRTQMDKTDIDELAYIFQNVSLIGWPETRKVMTKILLARMPKITSKQALRIHFALCRTESFSDAELKLYRIANRTLLIENGLLTNADILEILRSIKYGTELGNKSIYKPTFVEEFCYHMINRKPPINDLKILIRLIYQLRHVSNYLLQYMDQFWKTNPDKQLSFRSGTEFTLQCLKYFSDTNHKPAHWNNIERIIKRDCLQNCSEIDLLYCTLSLLALDCFIPQFVENVLKMELKSSSDNLVLLDVYRMVKVLHPESSLEPAPHILEKIREFCESEQYMEQAKWEKCWGGAEYVKSGLKTELGHNINHTLLLSEFGNFMPFDNDTGVQTAKFLKDLKVPTNRRLVLVKTFPNYAYHANLSDIRGSFRIRVESLQRLTHCPVLTINTKYLDYLTREKLEMVIQEAVTKKGDYEFITHFNDHKILSDGE